jgi:hypothetical protein
MYATGATINGSITATSGKITGNFQVESGTFYTGTSPTSTSVIINDKGLASISATNVTLTALLNTPISSGNIPIGSQPSVGTLPSAISFFTQAALIGGWVVNDTTIKDRSQQFVLDSTNKNILITGVIDLSTNFRVELGTGANVFSAGTVINGTVQTPSVSITRAGLLTANNAIIRGQIEATSGYIGSLSNGWTINDTGIFGYGTGAIISLDDGGILSFGNAYMSAIGNEFQIFDTDGYGVLSVPASGGRVLLGHLTEGVGRQVEVARSAQIAGDSQGSGARNSGGLRNMYTATVNNFVSYPNMYLTDRTANGDVLLLWTP